VRSLPISRRSLSYFFEHIPHAFLSPEYQLGSTLDILLK
jgi:hypothetical protein